MNNGKNIVIGIDVGYEGAIAMYDIKIDDIVVHKMPVIKSEKEKKLDVEKINFLFSVVSNNILMCGLEFQHPFPFEGVKSVFSLGKQTGILEAVLISQHIPYQYIYPVQWKKELGLKGKTKSDAMVECVRVVRALFTGIPVKTPRGKYLTGVIDAILIMLYTLLKYCPECKKAIECKEITRRLNEPCRGSEQ